MTIVQVPAGRLPRWIANFQARHGEIDAASDQSSSAQIASVQFAPGRVHTAPDFSWFRYTSLFGDDLTLPADWGVLVVRKGGFAVARMAGGRMVSSKVGRRHVQGRSKAGGQSQQRFARRRDNQAKAAYEAAAEYAVQHLGELRGPLVVGGDATALREVLAHPRLSGIEVIDGPHDVDEPRRDTLEEFVRRASSWQVEVVNEPGR